jgi:hypothetical protein
MEWVRIQSWHGVRTATRVPGVYVTLCGKRAHNEPVDLLPLGEKSCETCLRIYAKRADQ